MLKMVWLEIVNCRCGVFFVCAMNEHGTEFIKETFHKFFSRSDKSFTKPTIMPPRWAEKIDTWGIHWGTDLSV